MRAGSGTWLTLIGGLHSLFNLPSEGDDPAVSREDGFGPCG